AGKARKPYHGGFMMLDAGTVLLADAKTLEMNVGRAAKTIGDHARRCCFVGHAVYQNESTGCVILLIWVEGDGRSRCDVAEANFIEAQGFRRKFAKRIHIKTVPELSHGRGHSSGASFHEIGAAGQELVAAHPD